MSDVHYSIKLSLFLPNKVLNSNFFGDKSPFGHGHEIAFTETFFSPNISRTNVKILPQNKFFELVKKLHAECSSFLQFFRFDIKVTH